jgi:uncharacterized membrane protein YjfL (UPF0719 family)
MTIDQLLVALSYLVSIFILFAIGKWVYDKLHPSFDLKRELLEQDNFAVALTITGYYLGLVFALGGAIDGPSIGFTEDMIDIAVYGLASVIFLNISLFINDKIILSKFDNTKELIEDQNPGTGVVEAACCIASGLIIWGAVSGEGGNLITSMAFWGLGQVALILAGIMYNIMTPFDIHAEIERDNAAVGVAFAGALIAVGNLIRIGLMGDFESWSSNIGDFAWFTLLGLVLLPVLRTITDKILLPGRKLTDELVNQEKPNVGAGLIEAFAYVGGSILIGWAL